MSDWDDANIDHIAEHDVTPEEVEEAFADPDRILGQAYNVPVERRRAIIGATESGRLLFVAFTRRAGRIRVVTAYDAEDHQARQYDRARRR